MFQNIINQLANNPKRIFILDGFGALVSAFFLGIVLVKFETYFGMPKKELYYLAGAACLFAVYDLICYFKTNKNWRSFVKGIAWINMIYCFVSLGLVIFNWENLTVLGYVYFVIEIIILIVMINIEFKAANTVFEN